MQAAALPLCLSGPSQSEAAAAAALSLSGPQADAAFVGLEGGLVDQTAAGVCGTAAGDEDAARSVMQGEAWVSGDDGGDTRPVISRMARSNTRAALTSLQDGDEDEDEEN